MGSHTMPAPPPDRVPLCVDLDGTLVDTDTLYECFLAAVRRQPSAALPLLAALLREGRPAFKEQAARRGLLRAETLPYRADLLAFLEQRRGQQPLVLATAAHRLVAESVAGHLGLFDLVIATEKENLRGDAKRRALEGRFGTGGFDYAGNGPEDLAVWESARQAVLVNVSSAVRARVPDARIAAEFPRRRVSPRLLAKALRAHQWVKNLLVFVPLILAHRALEPERLASAVALFAAFSLAASAVYVINDLCDLESDRLHPVKKRRPFAAGQLPIAAGLLMIPALVAGAGMLSVLFLPWSAVGVLAGYLVLTTLYSFWAKTVPALDVAVLALLYTLRILAGGAAVNVPISPWLLALSLFGFTSLALVKRYAELSRKASSDESLVAGRGYQRQDLPVILGMGLATGNMLALVMALYLHSPEVARLYRQPAWLWPVCGAFVFWTLWLWLRAHRSAAVVEDPVTFALRDPATWGVAAFAGFLMWMAH